MLKRIDIHDAVQLHPYLVDPQVYPYVRYKANTLGEYLFVTKQVMEKEEKGELLIRTILDECGKAIGQIALYDIQKNYGFLGTWLGRPFHGKGYNQVAKESFFSEIFYETEIDVIYMKIRKTNEKSKKAALKLPYVEEVGSFNSSIYDFINQGEIKFDLFQIKKEIYELYMPNLMEA